MSIYPNRRPTEAPKTSTNKEKTEMKGYAAIEAMAAKRGFDITCAAATSWIGSLNHAMSYCGWDRDKAKKMHAFSYRFNGVIFEPLEAYPTLRLMRAAVERSTRR